MYGGPNKKKAVKMFGGELVKNTKNTLPLGIL